MRRPTVLAVLCVLALAGCGHKATHYDANGALDEISKGPKASFYTCKDVWQVGKTLPADYTFGCRNGGTVVVEAYKPCKDGKSRLFIHQGGKAGMDTEVAISGSEVHAYSSAARKAAVKECRRS